MSKKLVEAEDLVRIINSAIELQWNHVGTYCRVEALRKTESGTNNWQVDTTSTGGTTLMFADQCTQIQGKVIDELAEQYDVDWPN
jgi:hypothetical protein